MWKFLAVVLFFFLANSDYNGYVYMLKSLYTLYGMFLKNIYFPPCFLIDLHFMSVIFLIAKLTVE